MRLIEILCLALILSISLQPVQAGSAGTDWILDLLRAVDSLAGVGPNSAESGATTSRHITSSGSGNLTAHFIDVGQGDSILIQFGDKNLLIDGGERDMGPRVSSYLESLGISRIDILVATHPHSDHIGGLLDVLDRFEVGMVLDSGRPHTSRTYENFLIRIDQKDIPYQVAEAGQSIDLHPGLDIDVLSPPSSGLGDDLNENSIVLRVAYGERAFLLMGDAGTEAENEMISSGAQIRSDILKVGHHGSRSSSGMRFLERVAPEVSIISLGRDNPYGHPAPEILARLKRSGSQVYRTDLQGTVEVTTDGKAIFISPRGRQA